MDNDENRSLKETFEAVREQQVELETLDTRGAQFKHTLESIIHDLEQCRKLVNNLSVFSPNEELDDISTPSIQYLTIDYLLADLLLKTYDSNRLAALRRASRLLDSFLERLEQYRLLAKTDRELYEKFKDNRSAFSLLSASNFEDRRKLKIARFQEEKSLKQKLEHLRTQSRSSNVDEEVVRNLYLTEMSFDVHQSFQSLDMINQEIAILSQIQNEPARPPDRVQDDRSPGRSDQYSEKLDGPTTLPGLGRKGGPLLDSKGKPIQPFTILDKRSQMQSGVFRPGHNLPTMTIDEYLDEERKRGGIIDGGGNSAPQPAPDEDDIEQVDAATMKARDWDEFVEANPKGAGNTLNRG